MGWFWASEPAPVAAAIAFESNAAPPPSCPMHKSSSSNPLTSPSLSSPCPPSSDSACPYKPSPSGTGPTSSALSKLNPLNYMPAQLSNAAAPSQSVVLARDREASTIPRGDGQGNWEYPSPQQMYNALLRKGYEDTPAEHVTSMVAVHNFLNEGAWNEIREWERRFSGGLVKGWRECRYGEEGALARAEMEERERMVRRARKRSQPGGKTDVGGEEGEPKLVRFMGRPNELTPKAYMMQVLGWMYPQGFSQEPPFDRHDWYVLRKGAGGREREIRYVIDYYSGPPEPTGEPVFFLDVRPAVDGPTAACERMMRWGGDVWWRAMGGDVGEIKRSRS